MRLTRTSISDVRKQFSYLPRTFRLIWAAAPAWTAAWSILLVIQGLLPVALVYLTKLVVDRLLAAVKAGGSWPEVRGVIVSASLTAAVMVLMESLDSFTEWVRTAQAELIQDHIKDLIHTQSAAVDIAFYESPEFFDRLDQARGEASGKPLALLESLGSLMRNALTLVAMGILLIPYGVWLPLALLVSTLPAFYVVLRFDRKYHQWWKHATVARRWISYYDIMLTHNNAAAEVRLFGIGPHFRATYQKLRRTLRSERLHQLRRQSFARLGAAFAALIVSGATMVWMGWRALHGLATMGDLALFYQAFSRGQGVVQTVLGSLGQIYVSTLFLGNLFAFLDLEPRVVDPAEAVAAPGRLQKGIEFQNITFSYPGSERAALRDFSLEIPAGKIVAIVGANGAGKTTLLKLLCRFYDPQQGAIKLDGIDLRDVPMLELRRQFTVLFQQPLNYQATVADSIAMSDLGARPTREQIEAAARSAGAHEFISRLPKGYDTVLGKLFKDGAELSGGEWQRISMARAYLREAPIIMLDEPTSFLDSWSEVDWFARFRKLAHHKTAMLITHRFTIAMRADIIHVMDKGQIIESGSHHELVARGGFYAQSWQAQVEASASANSESGEQIEDSVTLSIPPESVASDVVTVI